ncbi:RNA polymerase sigma factor [Candidatus Entotheonella palauensis]|uniref:RNA polymerase sigma factor n=1 Tax=Candidatus Entotheonella palauensis TaxID=93172 RepID=UPI0015C476BF|nr:RNA polymerase sigma factor [Candidatus Entotheonella palauensis]
MQSGFFLDALDQLSRAYRPRVVGFCVAILPAAWKDEAEDVAQDAFVAAYRNMPRFRGEASIPTWFFSIVRKRCFSAIRTFKREEQRHIYSETSMLLFTFHRI